MAVWLLAALVFAGCESPRRPASNAVRPPRPTAPAPAPAPAPVTVVTVPEPMVVGGRRSPFWPNRDHQ